MQTHRLTEGGRIDRGKLLRFRFDGAARVGYAGDTLASALIANGVRVVGRSFKFHRPRGIMAAGVEEPNAVVQLGAGARSEPNLKATEILLHDGLEARSVNAWPSARFDVMGAIDAFAPFLPAGFYYKTFQWPHWGAYEWAIRRSAGLGVAPRFPDPDAYEHRYAFVDVLVVGGGPSGLAAARGAATAGARVMLVDDKPALGGSLLGERREIGGRPALDWVGEVVGEIGDAKDAVVLTRTTAIGYYDHNLVALCERLDDRGPVTGPRQRLWKVRAGRVILAAGAFERPLVFPDNDRPGVMLAGAAQAYVNRFAVLPGRRVVVVANNDSARAAARDLKAAGAHVVLVDSRHDVPHRDAESDVEVLCGHAPTSTRGRRAIRSVTVHPIDARGRVVSPTGVTFDCDLLCLSGGWTPAVHLFSQSGGKLAFDAALQTFVPARSAQREWSVGAASGRFTLKDCLSSGAAASTRAVEELGFKALAAPLPAVDDHEPCRPLQPLWRIDTSLLPGRRRRAWVDFQYDVTTDDLRIATDENYKSIEHIKRYTTAGMAVDQGKTSNVNAIGVVGELIDKAPPEIGTTTFRPPFNPVTIGAFAGRAVAGFYHPARRLPAHAAHRELGAAFEDYGGWLRPGSYRRAGESEADAVEREVIAVRERVGLFDGSPLGMIDIRGADAAEFLNRVYVNNMKSLQAGRARYGLMLNENGIVMDDGVLVRWGERLYQVGTSSGHARAVCLWLEEWLQCEWTDLDVVVEDVTTTWANVTLTGPEARRVLETFDTDIDLGADVFPHMAARVGHLSGVPVRLLRVSFTGEVSFEINVPAGYGESLWRAMFEAGRKFGIAPVGIEAWMVLRTEKGYLHVGTDTDGTTYPQDVGFAAVIAKKPNDFIGRRSTMRPEARRSDRRQLVGIEPVDATMRLPVGGHVVTTQGPRRSQGWITSSHWSPTLKRSVALGLVERGRDRLGEEVTIFHDGGLCRARLASPCAFDSQGARLDG